MNMIICPPVWIRPEVIARVDKGILFAVLTAFLFSGAAMLVGFLLHRIMQGKGYPDLAVYTAHGFGTVIRKAAIVLIAAGRLIYPGNVFRRDKNHMIVILRIGIHRFRKSGEREQIKPNGAVHKYLVL